MAVRKRTWKPKSGPPQERWIVDYADAQGDRHIRTFERKKEADAFHASVNVEVRLGIHTSPNKSPTVLEAARISTLRAASRKGSNALPSTPTDSTSDFTSCPSWARSGCLN
jgi:hypothetical protein